MEKLYFGKHSYRLGRAVAVVVAMFALLFTLSSPSAAAPSGAKPLANQQAGGVAGADKPASSSTPVSTQVFQDVAPGSFWYNYTFALYVDGIVSGYPCGTPPAGACVPPANLPYYLPNNGVSRGEMSRYIVGARNNPGFYIVSNTNLPAVSVLQHSNYYAITSTNTFTEGTGLYGEAAGNGSGDGLSLLSEGVYGYSSGISESVGLGAYSRNYTAAWFDMGDPTNYYNTFIQKGGLLVGDIISPTLNSAVINGDLTVAGTIHGHFSDTMRNTGSSDLHPGDIVVAGDSMGGVSPLDSKPVASAVVAGKAYDSGVLGVVEQRWVPGDPNAAMTAKARLGYFDPNTTVIHPGDYMSVVTLGTCQTVRVTASNGPIHVGDLLTTSDTAGMAMRVGDKDKVNAIGAIVGKALGNLDSGTGTVAVMVTLR